jgi:hypothetical protein
MEKYQKNHHLMNRMVIVDVIITENRFMMLG